MKQKIYDCFCYFNEDLILELRLETLWNYVDHFIVVESTKTISGHPKTINFNLERFHKYREKIRYLLIEEYPFETSDPWKNERYQRNFIHRGIADACANDWIIVSDVDEIPNPEALKACDPEKHLRCDLEQHAYSYFFNNLCVNNGKPVVWPGSKVVTYKNFVDFFREAEQVRNYKATGPLRAIKRAWFKKFSIQRIPSGGWHFTWIADIPKIIQKLESFAHQEFNTLDYKDPIKIKQKISSGMDILNPKSRHIPQPLDANLPAYLIQNPQKFNEWLLPIEH